MTSENGLLKRSLLRAAAACVLVALLAWGGFVAVREWQRNVLLLANRQAEDSADRFLMVLTRDMQAVQRSVLVSPALDVFATEHPPSDPPYEAVNLVAGALTRYSYPESFFLWQRRSPRAPTFFYREERRPPWARASMGPRRFPVIIDEQATVGERILDLIVHDAATRGRPFVVLETTLDGTPYQVVARLLYQDPLRQNIETAFGFLVNLAWAKQHYFAGLLQQTLPGDNGRGSVAVSVYDEQGRAVADDGIHPGTSSAYVSKRAFPPLFFNPLLVAAEPSSGERRIWTVQAAPRQDSSLIEAAGAANRMLILQILAAAMLAAGIVLSLQAAYASQRLSELRSDFVASVTHEFKTPIATIRAAGETLAAGRIQDAAAQQEYARFIVGEGRRLTRLVDNLLAFSRVTESVEIRQPLEPVALGDIVTQTLERFSIQLAGDGFQVDASVPETLPLILGDPTALSLMLENIIDNAVRHSRKERRLMIRGTADGRSVQLEISDGGGGIPEDELEHVTKKFFRGRHAGHGGTGLGLAIASRIAANHGGTLRITNQADVGTTVMISLPVGKGLDTTAAQQLAGAERRR